MMVVEGGKGHEGGWRQTRHKKEEKERETKGNGQRLGRRAEIGKRQRQEQKVKA